MDIGGDFDDVSWHNEVNNRAETPEDSPPETEEAPRSRADRLGKVKATEATGKARPQAEPADLAATLDGVLECSVGSPQKENDGTKDAFISYLVTTHTNFASFEKPTVSVRRRFTDFVFLYKALVKDFPAVSVPPLPDKHKMEYFRGDRFGSEFTSRRAHSLDRFLNRISLHPQLRRTAILTIFLESNDWNTHMRLRPQRGSSVSEPTGGGVFDSFTDTFLNAFSRAHKTDKRFSDIKERIDKMSEDLTNLEKIVGRVARREGDLEQDYADLATQFQKLQVLEPGVEETIHVFVAGVEGTSAGLKKLRDHTDQNYLGSIKDMDAYIGSLRSLLKAREQKQLDFEALTEYLNKAVFERDTLASQHGSNVTGPTSFFRSKMEDVRGVDHEQARRERLRKLELRIEELTHEVEEAKKTTEAFDEEVIREAADFERIKAAEFKQTLGELSQKMIDYNQEQIKIWEKFLKDVGEDPDTVAQQ